MPAIVYDIGLNYDTKAADASLSAFRARVITQLTELQSKSSKIELFKDLQGDSKKADDALQLIKQRSEELRAVLGRLSKDDVGFKQLTAEIKAVDKEFKTAEKSAGAVADRIKLLDVELKKAGVDTGNLTAEQLALAAALGKVQAAASVQTARSVLGVVGANEAKAQIAKLTQAYDVLHAAEKAGTITSTELAVAKRNLNREVSAVSASVSNGSRASSGFSGVLSTLGLGAGIAAAGITAAGAAAAAVAAGLNAAKNAAVAYEQGLARVSSISTQNKVQLQEMGAEVLKLTSKIGIDLPTAFDALYNIVSSGIPTENAVAVLAQSAQAAIAGVTDVSTAARIGVAVLNAYQLQVSELPRVFDVLFQTVKDGVVTFPELAAQLGEILPVARASGVGLEEVSAAMIVLTRNGINAAESSTGIQRAIQALSSPTPEAVASLLSLGVAYNGLEGTLKQLADKNLGADVLRNIIPDVRGQRAVTILTQQYALFKEELELTTKSAGAAKSAFDKLADTPEQQLAKLTATITALKVSTGEGLVPIFAALTTRFTTLITSSETASNRFDAFRQIVSLLGPNMVAAADAIARADLIMKRFGPELERSGVAANRAKFEVGELGESYLRLERATQKAAAVAVKSAGEFTAAFAPTASLVSKALSLVNAEIVGVESRLKFLAERLAAVATTNRTLFDQANTTTQQNLQLNIAAIETLLAKREIGEFEAIKRIESARQTSIVTELENLRTYSAQTISVFEKEAADRRALAAKNGKDLVAFDIESRDAKLKLIGELQAKYAAYVLEIANQEKKLTQDIKAQQNERRGIVETNEEAVRGIYRSGLNEFYKRVDIAREVEEKISKIRQAIASNDFEAAKQYANAANQLIISSVNTLTEEEKKAATGIIVRSQAQQKLNEVTGLLTPVIDANIKSLETLKTAYGVLKVEAVGAAVDISDKLGILRAEQAQAIPLRVKEDSAQIDAEIGNLQTKLAARDALVSVKLLTDAALAAAQQLVADIEKGKPQLKIDADFKELQEKTKAAILALPAVNLPVDDSKVLATFKDIGNNITELSKRHIDLQSNADQVATKLAEINGLTLTTKQLEIQVNYTYPNGKPPLSGGTATDGGGSGAGTAFARGGLVGAAEHSAMRSSAIAHFARGGFVGKVPGSGNQDTVFARLQNGSFVLRKTPSEILTDIQAQGNIFNRQRGFFGNADPNNIYTRQGFNDEGQTSVEAASSASGIDGFAAELNKRAAFDRTGVISGMLDAAIAQMRRNVTAYRVGKPLGFVEPDAEDVTERAARPRVRAVEDGYSRALSSRNESDANAATQSAVTLAQDLIKPLGAIDFKKFSGDGAGGNFFADGGQPRGAGIIDAMVTPGEHVFSPAEVNRIGLKKLLALNSANNRTDVMQRLRFAAGGYVNAAHAAAPTFGERWASSIGPTIDRFNAGGSVSNSTSSSNTNLTINAPVTINPSSNVNADQWAREMVPAIERQLHRRGLSLGKS